MTDHFVKVHNCVEDYFNTSLLQGRTPLEILDDFRDMPLPLELTSLGFEKNDIIRHGQLVATDLLLKQLNRQSAHLPDTDLLNAGA
jgi:hypothetical protein